MKELIFAIFGFEGMVIPAPVVIRTGYKRRKPPDIREGFPRLQVKPHPIVRRMPGGLKVGRSLDNTKLITYSE